MDLSCDNRTNDPILFLIWLKWPDILNALEMVGRSTHAGWKLVRLRSKIPDDGSDRTRVDSTSSGIASVEKDVSKIV